MSSKFTNATLIACVLMMACLVGPASVARAQTPQDPGWPRVVNTKNGKLVYYQPQVSEWRDYRHLTADMAVSVQPAGGQAAVGAVSVAARTEANRTTRTVYVRDIQITDVRFPSASPENRARLETAVRSLLPTGALTISLDRLMASIEQTKVATQPVAVNTAPPPIFVATAPAAVLVVEGEPVRAEIDGAKLEFVVNTNWDLFIDQRSSDYFVLLDDVWMRSSALEGPWAPVAKLPSSFERLPREQHWDRALQNVPARPARGPAPSVFMSRVPAELIQFAGQPEYAAIPGTRLVYASNTDSDVFVDSDARLYYTLLAGRWFRAASLDGPWSFANDSLPADFAKIPTTSPRARVRACVPGTREAADALLLAQVPTRAVVSRTEAARSVSVSYYGDPQFQPIASTSMRYAVNTDEKIVSVENRYYLCKDGVWFVSSASTGPWQVATSVPKEIYSIPPSSPVHNVTYVTIEKDDDDDDDEVTCHYTAGYLGAFVLGTAYGSWLCWGTGYYYPAYYAWSAYAYPIYRPWPATYGVGAVYNPWTGGYAVGGVAYGPYAAVGGAAWYNPATGRYGRGAAVYGPNGMAGAASWYNARTGAYGGARTAQTWYGGRTVAGAYNPWTNTGAATRQGSSPYAQWGTSVVRSGDDWARTGHVTTDRGTVGGVRTSNGDQAIVRHNQNGTVVRGENNVYVGKDGNVYRRDGQASWSRYENGGWNTVQRPNGSETVQGLERQAVGREHGANQQRRAEQFQRNSNPNRSFQRPSFNGGGGFRGGGPRRRA